MTEQSGESSTSTESGEDTQAQQALSEAVQSMAPWERDGEEFDAQRAWDTIQHLRRQNGTLKTDRETLQGRVTEFEQQGLSEVDKLTRRAEKSDATAQAANGELTRLQVALKHGLVAEKDGAFVLDEDAMKLLGTGTAEELDERAKLISARSAKQPQQSRGFTHGPTGQAPKGDMNSLIFGSLRK